MKLEGKVAIVTGAAVRLGRAQALALAECGVRLVVHYNTSSGPADEVESQIQEMGSQSIAVQADLSHPMDARAIVEQAVAPQIQVNAIAPGLILPPPGQGPDYLDRYAPQIPLQRTGTADEIAQALLFLLRSDFVTGELLYITGGEHLLAGRHT